MLKKTNGLHLTIEYASYVFDEVCRWIAFFTEDEKVNTLHAQRLGKLSALDVDVLLAITTRINQYKTNRKKQALEQQEQKELQEEEMLVKSLLTEN
jgi:hypothetical protein